MNDCAEEPWLTLPGNTPRMTSFLCYSDSLSLSLFPCCPFLNLCWSVCLWLFCV